MSTKSHEDSKPVQTGGCCGAPSSAHKASDNEGVRSQVSEAYANAIARVEKGSGCCGPAGAAAQLVDYGKDLQGVISDAANSSFGCGNPLAFAGVEAGQTVLDLGSGAGLDLLIASKKVGPNGHVIGVDMTDEMIDAAHRNLQKAGVGNVELRKGIIEALPVEDNSVDWVISNCVINLSPEKEKVFAEIARVLRPGGRISISDIVVEDLPAWIRDHAAAYSACIGGAISESDYKAGLEKAGLHEVEVTERQVYDENQLKAIVASDLEALDIPVDSLLQSITETTGKVWSAKFTGRLR